MVYFGMLESEREAGDMVFSPSVTGAEEESEFRTINEEL